MTAGRKAEPVSRMTADFKNPPTATRYDIYYDVLYFIRKEFDLLMHKVRREWYPIVDNETTVEAQHNSNRVDNETTVEAQHNLSTLKT